jgi:hypothetical protein
MFIKVSADLRVQLADANNFRSFKIVVEDARNRLDHVRRRLAGLAEVPDHDTAWVSAATLRRWPGVAHDPAWQEGFSGMIEKARPHGWIDDARGAIKAHVEWKDAGKS